MTALFIDEVAQYLVANGCGTLGTNIFEGYMPDSPDAALCVYETAGLRPDVDVPIHYPSFQIVLRDSQLDLGEARVMTIRVLLHNLYNVQFISNGTYVYACNLTGEGGHIGQDDKGRDMFSLNFNCEVR